MSKHHDKKTEKHSNEDEDVKKDCEGQQSAAGTAEKAADPFCSIEIHTEPEAGKDCSSGQTEEKADTAAELEALQAKCRDLQEQYLRKAADFENYRKRMIKEKQEAIDYANTNLLSDLIQVLDDFDRAIEAGKAQEAENKAFAEGVLMIKNQMTSLLSSKYGLTYYPAKGEPFDPNLHEAVSMIQSPDVTEALVGEELQKGYKLKERVIRHSKVMVLMPQEKRDEKTAAHDTAADNETNIDA